MVMQGRILRTVVRDVSFCGSREEGAITCDGEESGRTAELQVLSVASNGSFNGRMCAGVPVEEVEMWLGRDIGHSG